MSWPPLSKQRELAAARRKRRKSQAKKRRDRKRWLRTLHTAKREREGREPVDFEQGDESDE